MAITALATSSSSGCRCGQHVRSATETRRTTHRTQVSYVVVVIGPRKAYLSRASSRCVIARFPCSSAALIPASPSTMLSLCAKILVSKKTMVFVLNVLRQRAPRVETMSTARWQPQQQGWHYILSGSSQGEGVRCCRACESTRRAAMSKYRSASFESWKHSQIRFILCSII